MRADDFFEDHIDPADDLLGLGEPMVTNRLRRDLIRSLRIGPQAEADDEVAVALARLVHDELESYGTGGGERLGDEDMRDALLALRAVLKRLAVPPLDLPFRDFTTFRSHWLKQGASGSWQARRDILNDLFGPLHDELADMETRSLERSLADPVSPRGRTGWSRIDAEVAELRRHFGGALTPQDYRNVGNDCTIVMEALSRQLYDPDRHLREGEQEPPVNNTKQRLERFVEDAATGPENAALRKLARAGIEMAQAVKHNPTPDRRSAGVAADATILLANLLRRLADE